MKLPNSIEKLLAAINDDGTVRSIVIDGIAKNKNDVASLCCFKGRDILIVLKSEADNARMQITEENEGDYNALVTTGAWLCEVIAMWCEDKSEYEWAKRIRSAAVNKVRDTSNIVALRTIERGDDAPL